MAVFAPIPKASVTIAASANPGFFASTRTPYRISAVVLHRLDAAHQNHRLPPRFLRRHPARQVQLDLPLQVILQLRIDLPLHALPPQKKPKNRWNIRAHNPSCKTTRR
jgi:hypothetical protein